MRHHDGIWHGTEFHEVAVEVQTPNFVINGTPYAAPFPVQSGRIGVDATGQRFAVLTPADGDTLVIARDGHPEPCILVPRPSRTAGRGSAAMFGAEVHCQGTNEDPDDHGDPNASTTITVYDARTGTWVREYKARYGSVGILQVLGPEEILSTADPRAFGVINGVRFWYLVSDKGYQAGQVEVIPPGGTPELGSIGLVRPSGEIVVAGVTPPTWHGYTNMPAYIAVSDAGQVRVYIQDSDMQTSAPGPTEIVWHTPVEPPVVIEPLPPSVIPLQRPTWIVDSEAILTPRGNGISTSDGRGPRYFEDALWVTPEMEPTLEAIYWGPEPPRNNLSREQAFLICAELARRNGVPVCVCDEWGPQATAEWMGRFMVAECRAVWMIEAYRPAGESQDEYRRKTRARLDAVGREFAVIAPYFEAQAGGSEAESIHTLNILREELVRTAAVPIVINLFGLRRPPRSATREADAAAWIDGTMAPASLRTPVPPPVEEKPPVVIVVPPPQKPPNPIGSLTKLILALKKLFGRRR